MPPSESKRTHRVGELLREELAKLLLDGVRDPRVGFVTVTEARPSPDLRTARVYVSVYGSDEERKASLDGLKDARGYLQRELGKRLRMKFVPELQFVEDDSLERAARLDTVIGAIHDGAHELPGELAEETLPVATSRTDLAERAHDFEPTPEPEAKAARPRGHRRHKTARRRSR